MGKDKRITRAYLEGILFGTEKMLKVVETENIPSCKYCGKVDHIVRFGTYKGVQRWWCKKCKRKFSSTDTLLGMKTPNRQIASALSMYYGGMSLNGIRRHFEQQHDYAPSESTLYSWLMRFSKKAVKEAKDYKPDVGDVWIADETVLRIGGDKVWFWDIIDAKTRFLLASHMSHTRTTYDARVLLNRAARRAEKPPKVIVTDKLQAYIDGIELNFGAETRHIQAKKLTAKQGTQIIERFHGSLKDRTKVMRGLKKRENSRLLMDGWLVHYNFFRTHESLDDRTPAEKAGIKFAYQNWLDVVREPKETNRIEIKLEPRPILRLRHQRALTPRIPRLTPRTPRISRKPPRLGKNELYVGRGMVSRHHFRGARRRRII